MLNLKFILTAGLKNIAMALFRTKIGNIVSKVTADATVNAGLNPTPAAMATKLGEFDTYYITTRSYQIISPHLDNLFQL